MALRFLRTRLKPTWRTPKPMKFEVLCDSGRFDEALVLHERPELRIGKDRLAVVDIVARREAAGVQLRSRPDDDDYQRVLQVCFAHVAG